MERTDEPKGARLATSTENAYEAIKKKVHAAIVKRVTGNQKKKLKVQIDENPWHSPARNGRAVKPMKGLSELKCEIVSISWSGAKSRTKDKNGVPYCLELPFYSATVRICGNVYYWVQWQDNVGRWQGELNAKDWYQPFGWSTKIRVEDFMNPEDRTFKVKGKVTAGFDAAMLKSSEIAKALLGGEDATPFTGFTYTDETGNVANATLTATGMDAFGQPAQEDVFVDVPNPQTVPQGGTGLCSVNSLDYALWKVDGSLISQAPYASSFFLESAALRTHLTSAGLETDITPTPAQAP